MYSTIEVFLNGKWAPAAEFQPAGRYKATFAYLPEYVFGGQAVPVALNYPIDMEWSGVDAETGAPDCPAFLLDLVPQGRGRKLLVEELKIADGEDSDLLLVQYGAFNAVGNLRIDTAVEFYEKWQARNPNSGIAGFRFKDIISRKEEFLEHIWMHAMYAAGTTGVQGAAPKFLLTQNQDDLWFADAALLDTEAAKHWLVKLPRGTHETDYAVLRNEAAYLRVAERCGLRTGGEPIHEGGMLFVPRFDRIVSNTGLHRLPQETLASLAGSRGFGIPVSLFKLVDSFRSHVSNPVEEIAEFIKRDILNLALRNTDNHARNTSVQRLPDGTIQLTPVYDFAPMYLDQEMIVRGCRWSTPEIHEVSDLSDIVGLINVSEIQKQEVVNSLRDFSGVLQNIEGIMEECGVDKAVIEYCKPYIDAQ